MNIVDEKLDSNKETISNVQNNHIIEKELENKKTKEKWYFKFIQISIPFLIAGFGMVGAGILFSYVQVY